MATIGIQRLNAQRILGEKCQTPHAVTQWMGAIQAQDYHQALWAIGIRMPAATLPDIETAIEDGSIVRTWSQRGTIHFVPTEDVKWMLDLCASRIVAGHGRRMQQLDLTLDIMSKSERVILKALEGGRRMARPDLFDTLEQAGISTEGQRGYHIVWHLAHHGLVCIGPMAGKQPTFVLLDEWAQTFRNLSRDEALAELVWRYFVSHTPATEADFARWSGLTLTDTRHGLELNRHRLTTLESDGVTYWHNPEAHTLQLEPTAHLLPGFDEFIIGYQDRSAVVPDEHAPKIVPGNNGIFRPVMVMNGQVVGTWQRKLKRKSVDITLQPFAPLGDSEAAIMAAAAEYSRFMGVDIGSVSTE